METSNLLESETTVAAKKAQGPYVTMVTCKGQTTESKPIQPTDVFKGQVPMVQHSKVTMETRGQQESVAMATEGQGPQLTGSGVGPRLENLHIQPQGEDVIDMMRKLSPGTQQNLGVLLKSLTTGEAHMDYNKQGKPVVEYKDTKKIPWDASNANVIATARSEIDVQQKLDACLELIDVFKSQKPPSGVLLHKGQISLSPRKQYREGHEFEKTMQVIGKGNSAGDILVLKDKKTGKQHACKTIMISVFRPEEVRCWVDMGESGCVPALYMLTVEGNRVCIHMEILSHAKTLRSIIDDHMGEFYTPKNRDLRKPFSLFVLDGALATVAELNRKGWTHNDLHGGNVMLQNPEDSKLKIKILDFGLARSLEDPMTGIRGFKSDITEILRIFSGLYTGQEFDNSWDMQYNYGEKLDEMAGYIGMSEGDRKELFCLVDAAMGLMHPKDFQEYRETIHDRLSIAMAQAGGSDSVMKKVAAILFPESFKKLHSPTAKNDVEPDGPSGDMPDCLDTPTQHFQRYGNRNREEKAVSTNRIAGSRGWRRNLGNGNHGSVVEANFIDPATKKGKTRDSGDHGNGDFMDSAEEFEVSDTDLENLRMALGVNLL